MLPSTPTKRKTSRSSPGPSSKRSKPTPRCHNPPITSRFIKNVKGTSGIEEDTLPPDRQALYELLKKYHKEIAAKAAATKVKAEQKRHASHQIRIIAAMGWLHAPWDAQSFEFWRSSLKRPFIAHSFTNYCTNDAQEAITAWTQKRGLSENSTNTARSTETIKAQKSVVRSSLGVTLERINWQKINMMQKAWYGGRCILTGSWEVEACHIVANSIEKNEDSPFWRGLYLFWSEDKVEELRAMIKTPEYQVTNLLVLRRDCHTLLEQCQFVLKPLSPTVDGELHLEFGWLDNKQPGHIDNSRSADMSILHWAKHGETSCEYETGDRIILTTNDPSTFPLPSAYLLNLQYHFNKIVRASAAAEHLELLFHHDTFPDLGAPASVPETPENDYEYGHLEVDPEFVEFLIQSAIRHGILSEAGAEVWRDLLTPPEEVDSEAVDSEEVDSEAVDSEEADSEEADSAAELV